jgi:hypothetical protein
MKHILLLSILLCAIALPAFADLTPQDLDKIDSIVKDSETQMKEHINLKVEGVEKQITLLTNVVYGLIALIVAAIAIPQLILAWRSGKDRSLERQIEVLTREIETLKQQRIVNP